MRESVGTRRWVGSTRPAILTASGVRPGARPVDRRGGPSPRSHVGIGPAGGCSSECGRTSRPSSGGVNRDRDSGPVRRSPDGILLGMKRWREALVDHHRGCPNSYREIPQNDFPTTAIPAVSTQRMCRLAMAVGRDNMREMLGEFRLKSAFSVVHGIQEVRGSISLTSTRRKSL